MVPAQEPAIEEIPLSLGEPVASEFPPLHLLDTVLYAAAFFGFLALLGLAVRLNPAPGGLGTHTQLHLPPCGIWVAFGKPCPSCGMTTAFAWMARGRLANALRAQPAGVAVFLSALGWWFYLPFGFLKRQPFAHIFGLRAFFPTVLGLIAVILGVWALRLAGWM